MLSCSLHTLLRSFQNDSHVSLSCPTDTILEEGSHTELASSKAATVQDRDKMCKNGIREASMFQRYVERGNKTLGPSMTGRANESQKCFIGTPEVLGA